VFDFTKYPPKSGLASRLVKRYPFLKEAAAVSVDKEGKTIRVYGDDWMADCLPKTYYGYRVQLNC
jgi:hypothetical protein